MDELTIGPFSFSYERPGMTVVKGEEAIGYCEIVTREEWDEFVAAVCPPPPEGMALDTLGRM